MFQSDSRRRIRRAVARDGSTFTILWLNIAGGTLDPVTGAVDGGVESYVSGTLKAFRHQESATTALRQYTEIQVGDLILDLDPEALVTVPEGQMVSGTIALDALANSGVTFKARDGQLYRQQKLSGALADVWALEFGDQTLVRTILLRKAT